MTFDVLAIPVVPAACSDGGSTAKCQSDCGSNECVSNDILPRGPELEFRDGMKAIYEQGRVIRLFCDTGQDNFCLISVGPFSEVPGGQLNCRDECTTMILRRTITLSVKRVNP